jgi:hypothetical protein
MANPVKGAISQLGERIIDTSKGMFSAISDAFGKSTAGEIKELQTQIRTMPSVPEPTIDNAPLMAAHNTSVEGILVANEIGGIPSPSIAISDPANLQKFGEISLIMDPNKLDPNMNIYPTDAYTGRQPKGKSKIANEKQFIERMKADVNFSHMDDAGKYLLSGSPEDADLDLKIVNAAIANGLVNPKDFNNFGELFGEASRKLGSDRDNMSFLNQYDGISEYAEVKRMLPPIDPYYSDGSHRPDRPETISTVLKDMREGKYGPMYMPASEAHAQNYAGAFRAATSRPFQSIDEVKDARGQIYVEERDNPNPSYVSNPLEDLFSQFHNVKMSLLDDLTEKFTKTEIRTRRSRNEDGEFITTQEPITRMMGMETANELLLALGRNDADIARTAAVSEGFVSMDDIPALRDAVNRLGEIMQTAPTKYFEAKPNAAISLSDFDVALVPQEVTENPQLMQIFRENNLPVSTYQDFGANKDTYREGVMRGMNENLFSVPLAGTLGYGALQGVGDNDGESGS